jgi:hypothetical protein
MCAVSIRCIVQTWEREMTVSRRTFMGGAASIAGIGALGGLPMGAFAQDVDFSGRTIEWIVPFPEGGGSGVLARFLQPYLTKHMPGNPVVVIRNIAGGGSITGANEFAATARPDGNTIMVTSATTQFPYLLGDPRVRYDYTQFEPLMVSPTGGVVYLPPQFGVTSAAELGNLGDQELVYGSQGPTSLDLVPMMAFLLMGTCVMCSACPDAPMAGWPSSGAKPPSTIRRRAPIWPTSSRLSMREARCRSFHGVSSTRTVTSRVTRLSQISPISLRPTK